MVIGLFPMMAKLQLPVEAAAIPPPVAGSIPISTRAELEAIRDDLWRNYHLVNDIDLAGSDWTPIGSRSNPRTIGGVVYYQDAFGGSFDGQGFTIYNMTITGLVETAGLFGYVDSRDRIRQWGYMPEYAGPSVIRNLNLAGTNINVMS
jgi:hypothetical protein